MGFSALERGRQRLARLLEAHLDTGRAAPAAPPRPLRKPWEEGEGSAPARSEKASSVKVSRVAKPWEREPGAAQARAADGERVTPLPTRAAAVADAPPQRRRVDCEAGAALALSQPLSEAAPAMDPGELRAGDLVDGFCEIEQRIGRSRYYSVYRARHRAWDLDVVVKVPRLEAAGGEVLRGSFCAAAERWTALGLHPNIAYCYYTRVVDRVPMAVLEHVGGGNLQPWIASGRTRNLRVGISLALQICHALEWAHDSHLWHGAVRPENCLMGDGGDLAVTDFGIAGRVAAGTPEGAERADGRGEAYVAPECWVDPGHLDARVDIFSLGVCLYEMLVGVRPYEMTRGPRRPVAAPRAEKSILPESLAALLQSCVAWEPGRRPQSVAEVRRRLAAIHVELFGKASAFADLAQGSWEADGWNNRAVSAQLFGAAEDAEMAWENALAANPKHLAATYNYGVSRWRAGTLPDSAVVRQLESVGARASELAPLLASVHCERGDHGAARSILLGADGARLGAKLEASVRAAEPATREEMRRELTGFAAYLTGVSLSADGKLMCFVGDDGGLYAARTDAVEAPREFPVQDSALSWVSLGASGERVVTAEEDGAVRLWEVSTRRCVQEVSAPGKALAGAFNEKRSYLALACSGGDNFIGLDGSVLLVWDLARNRMCVQLKGHTNTCKAVAMSAEGNIAVSGADDLTVRVWDLDRGGQCRRVLEGNEHFISDVAVSADGQVVVSAGWDKTVRVWNVGSGQMRVLHGHMGIVTAVAVSDDGSTVVSAGWDRTVRIWNAESGRCLRTIDAHSGIVAGIAVSADGRVAASVGWDRAARVWSVPETWEAVCVPLLARRRPYAELPSGEPEPEELCASGEEALRAGRIGEALAAVRRARASEDPPERAAELWGELSRLCTHTEVIDLQPHAEVQLPFAPVCAALTAAGRWVAGGGVDGNVTLWNLELERRERVLEGHRGRVVCVAMNADDEVLFSGGVDRTVRAWEPETGHCRRVLEGHAGIVSCLAASPDGRWVLSGGYDHQVRLWEVGSGRCAAVFSGHRRQISAVDLDVVRGVYASADRAGLIRVAGTRVGAAAVELTGHAARVTGLSFGSDGRLLSCDAAGALRVWDVESGTCLALLEGNQSPLVWQMFRADMEWAAAVAVDGNIFFWNTRTGQATATANLRAPGTIAAALAPDEQRLLAVGSDCTAAVWDLEWDLAPPRDDELAD